MQNTGLFNIAFTVWYGDLIFLSKAMGRIWCQGRENNIISYERIPLAAYGLG